MFEIIFKHENCASLDFQLIFIIKIELIMLQNSIYIELIRDIYFLYIIWNKNIPTSANGLVVKFIVAIDEPPVQFRVSAFVLFFSF